MSSTSPYRAELSKIVALALPMMGAQGGLMAMGVVDTLMVGRISSLEMAAVSLGNSVSGVIIVLGIGVAMGIEPLVAQALGSGSPARARRWLWQGLYLSFIVSIPLVVLMGLATFAFEPAGIPAALAGRTSAYLWSRVPGVIFNCTYAALRSYLTSIGKPRPVLSAVLLANVLNAGLDVVLIFGLYGAPELGVVGAGIATSASWIFMTFLLAYSVRAMPLLDNQGRASHGYVRPDAHEMREILHLGWPIALQISAEVGIFTLVSVMIGRLGEVQLAGHQIAIMLASLSFMCAVGIAIATTARVGFHVGAGDTPMARRTGFLGIGVGGIFMGVCGAGYAVFREPLAALFSPTDPAAQAIGAQLLWIAAVFAVSDGVQTVSAGALRGAGDTRWPFYANFAAHWVIALPVALYLGLKMGLGSVGYWWGLTTGLAVVAIILVGRFAALSSRPIARVEGRSREAAAPPAI